MTFQELPAPGSRSPRTAVTLVVATLGLGLNLRASILLGPHLHERFDVGPGAYVRPDRTAAAGGGAGAAAGGGAHRSVRRAGDVPGGQPGGRGVGDRHGIGRLATGGRRRRRRGGRGGGRVRGGRGARVADGCPYGRRGLALGVFGLGVAVAGLLSAVSRGFDLEGRQAALVLGASLVGFAGLAALVLRDPVDPVRAGSPIRECARDGPAGLGHLVVVAVRARARRHRVDRRVSAGLPGARRSASSGSTPWWSPGRWWSWPRWRGWPAGGGPTGVPPPGC